MKNLKTPYYLIDESALLSNLKKVEVFRQISGAKVLLATKCFSIWSVFPLIKKYVDGTTNSSLYGVRLGHDKIGKETHAYSVGYKPEEIKVINKLADKIIFNSISQLTSLCHKIPRHKIGLRINPGVSYSHFELDNPACPYSRLGESSDKNINQILPYINGAMFHFNCENNDYENICENLRHIEFEYRNVLQHIKWMSIGGGISFTSNEFPLEEFAWKIKELSKKNNDIQIYLEPGEALITDSAKLVTSIVDITKNVLNNVIIDASTEAHMLDTLIYGTPAKISNVSKPGYIHSYTVNGRSCLAEDIFGEYCFKDLLKVGDTLCLENAAGYNMVKKNWSNGLQMPSIAVKRLSGKIELIREFKYKDYMNSLS